MVLLLFLDAQNFDDLVHFLRKFNKNVTGRSTIQNNPKSDTALGKGAVRCTGRQILIIIIIIYKKLIVKDI